MGGSVLDPRDKGERRKIKGVESSKKMGKGRAEGKEMEETRGRKGGREGRMVVATRMNLQPCCRI